MSLTLLNLPRPKMTADVPTGVSISDLAGMEQFFLGIKTASGKKVTPSTAMRASAVLACTRILMEDLSALPLILYKRLDEGTVAANDHPLYRILDFAPNSVHTSMELREHNIFDLITMGAFYNLKDIDESGQVTSLWPLPATYVVRRYRELVWTFTDPVTGISGEATPDTLWRGTILSDNGIDGRGITLLAREAIGLLLAAEEQGARLFSNGIQSDLALQVAENLGDDERKQLKASVAEAYGGSRNAFNPLLLEGGLEAKRIGLTAQESQYIEARNYQTADIARMFRIPGVMLGLAQDKGSTFASAEQFFGAYAKYCLRPWATRIEQTISRDLLSPSDSVTYFAKHDFTDLMRGDTAARYASYATGIQNKFLSPNDARRAENMTPIEGLDTYTGGAGGASPNADPNAPVTPANNTEDDDTGENGKKNRLVNNVAAMIFRREQRALLGASRYKDPEQFYAIHAGFVEDLTGASVAKVLAYCEMRRKTEDRFSAEAQTAAVNALIRLCKGDN